MGNTIEQIKPSKWNNFQQIMQDMFSSNVYLVMELIVAVVGFACKAELIAIGCLGALLSFNALFSKDCTSGIFTFCLLTMVPLGFYGAKPEDFMQLWWLFLLLPPSFIAHFFLYPAKNLQKGEMMLSIGLYSIALLLGGIGSISVKDYFQLAPLYYILILGPAMICFYLYFMAYVPDDTSKVIDCITRSMIMLGIMIICMWLTAYIENIKAGNKPELFFPYRQWKNNIGNFTLLTMPFAFYAATYKKDGFIYFLLGLAEYACIILSMCRGAMVFSTILLPFIIIATFIFSKSKGNRITYGIIVGLCIIALCTVFIVFKETLLEKLDEAIAAGSSGRGHLYDEAWQNFLSNPVFGVGIGYRNDRVYPLHSMTMFWYHSTFMQVIGSMGLVGLVTWAYMTFVRFRILIRKNAFNIFMLLAFLGFEGYSMINTGDFSPFPFVTFLTFLLTVTSKHNKYLASLNPKEVKEKVTESKVTITNEVTAENA